MPEDLSFNPFLGGSKVGSGGPAEEEVPADPPTSNPFLTAVPAVSVKDEEDGSGDSVPSLRTPRRPKATETGPDDPDKKRMSSAVSPLAL
jgi:hypothetical protein